MTQSFGTPHVVPYVDYHTGEKRGLTLHLRQEGPTTTNVPPIVSIDGRQYIVYWGTVSFEIPADRPCHVSVHIEGEAVVRAASMLLSPGPTITLTYTSGGMMGVAKLAQS